MPEGFPTRRLLYAMAWLAPAWALTAIATGGVGWMIGPLRISSRDPFRPFVLGLVVAAFYAWQYPALQQEEDGRWFEHVVGRAGRYAVPLLIVLTCMIGVRFGSFAAAGSDSYGYVSQAALWLRGNLQIAQPWVQEFAWPNREWAFAPLGYRPISADGTIVPTYAPGLPILMALFLGVAGANGPFLVVPALGALTVWLTYRLGREVTGSRLVGVASAAILLATPVFLAHLMLPMTDVPVAAGWTLVLVLALQEPRPRPLAAGIAAGLTLLIRPNLLLLAAVPVLAWSWPAVRRTSAWRDVVTSVLWFGIGLSPAAIAIAGLNTYLYGSPLVSGYGSLGDMYWLSSAVPNLRNYWRWLAQSQTYLVTLAVIPFFASSALRAGERRSSARDGTGQPVCAHADLVCVLQPVRCLVLSTLSTPGHTCARCFDGGGCPVYRHPASRSSEGSGGRVAMPGMCGVRSALCARSVRLRSARLRAAPRACRSLRP
jgi:hypothetical protein